MFRASLQSDLLLPKWVAIFVVNSQSVWHRLHVQSIAEAVPLNIIKYYPEISFLHLVCLIKRGLQISKLHQMVKTPPSDSLIYFWPSNEFEQSELWQVWAAPAAEEHRTLVAANFSKSTFPAFPAFPVLCDSLWMDTDGLWLGMAMLLIICYILLHIQVRSFTKIHVYIYIFIDFDVFWLASGNIAGLRPKFIPALEMLEDLHLDESWLLIRWEHVLKLQCGMIRYYARVACDCSFHWFVLYWLYWW